MTEQVPIPADAGLARIAAGARVIDVRSLAGRTATGSIDGATIVAKDAVAEFAATVDADEDIVVYCGTTAGSGPVVDWLTDNGFTNVAHIEGGFDALKTAGAPVAAPAEGVN